MPRKLERKLILFELNKTLMDFALDSEEIFGNIGDSCKIIEYYNVKDL